MTILLLKGWANAKLAAASITMAIKHRAAIFTLENTCSFKSRQKPVSSRACESELTNAPYNCFCLRVIPRDSSTSLGMTG